MFLIIYFFLYGGLHVHFFLKVRAAFAPGAVAQAALVFLLFLGVMTPIIVRAAERVGLETPARLFSWVGYTWMAILLLFCSVSFVVEFYRFVIWLPGRISHGEIGAFLPSARALFFLPLVLSLAATGYGLSEARQIRTERVEIHSAKIPKALGKIRIVQISDVHVGVLVRGERLASMLRVVREAKPDLIISTGDLVDGQLNSMAEAEVQLRELQPRYGKFAITGNHEFYAGFDDALEFTRRAGFTILRGEVATVAGAIALAGVDDPTSRSMGPRGNLSDREVAAEGKGLFTILLKHQPRVERDAPGAFDLQLSGHTHNGQIFPFTLITRLYFPYQTGNYSLANGALLHVSRGTGTWGPPVRFLSPPEVTVIDLLPV